MKVLHVITGLGIGGAEQQLRLLLRHLPVRSSVVTLTNPGAVAAGIEADGTPVTHLGMTGNRDLGALPRLARFVRQGRYDLVHTHLYRACVYGRTAARLAGVRRVIATEHSLGETQIEGRPLSAGTRALYLASERLGTSTVAVSPSVARRLAEWGVPPERIRIVPNGIETDRFAFDCEGGVPPASSSPGPQAVAERSAAAVSAAAPSFHVRWVRMEFLWMEFLRMEFLRTVLMSRSPVAVGVRACALRRSG